ncbi:MAG: carboxypeptidase-like regulatory domain-containing protein [Actinomycetota bacterium]|nr:carboxypeptidase-like regulatory domain-containing protein [Actinomycetota bacterium]
MKIERGADVETLTKALRAMGDRLGPAPDGCTAAAANAFSLRTIDRELATLDYDSLLDDDPKNARPPGGLRHLTFVAKGLCVEVDVGADRLFGRIVPPSAADVELRWPDGSTSVTADESGGFSVSAVPPGPISLRFQRGRSDPGPPVVTDWVTL